MRHPYLYFTREDIPSMKNKLSHPWMARKWKHLLRMGDRLVPEDWTIPEPGEDGTEAHYTPAGMAFATRVKLLAFLWLLTENRRYLDTAKRHILHVCGWRRWCGLGRDGRVQPTIDAGIFGTATAIVYDWLHDDLSEEERGKIRRAMIEHAAKPICRKYLVDDKRELTGLEINWPAQWFGAVGLIGLTLREEDPESEAWIKRAEDIMRGIVYYRNDPDGGGHEGPGYVFYMSLNAVLFSDALRRVTGSDLLDAPFLANLGKFLLNTTYLREKDTWKVNFNDAIRNEMMPMIRASPYTKFDSIVCSGTLLTFLARQYRDAQALWLYGQYLDRLDGAEEILGDNWNNPFEVIWFDPELAPASPESQPLCRHFRETGWITCRTGWKTSDTLFAFKSGRAAWWHNQNDKNHFILWADGERLIIDPGITPYIFSLKDPERLKDFFTYFGNTGHNTLIVDEEGQLTDGRTWDFRFYGPEAGRRESIEQAGRVLDFIDASFGFYIRADGTGPYYGRLAKWHRHIFSAGLRYLVVFDQVECSGERRIELTLHTPEGLVVDGNTATLTKDGRGLMTVRVLNTEGMAIQKKKGFGDGEAHLWVPPEKKLKGDPIDLVPKADFLSVRTQGKVNQANFLSIIDVHKAGKQNVGAVECVPARNASAIRITENGISSLALFRTGPGSMSHDSIATNACFAFLSPAEKADRILLSSAESLSIDGVARLKSSRPVTAALKSTATELTGRIQTSTMTDLELHADGPVKIMAVEGGPPESRYDRTGRTARLSLWRGVYTLDGATSPPRYSAAFISVIDR